MFYFIEVTLKYPGDMIDVRFFGQSAILYMTAISCTAGESFDIAITPSHRSDFGLWRAFLFGLTRECPAFPGLYCGRTRLFI
jgi:hypothetical protein